MGAIVWLLDNVFNPTHINHLVLIRDLPNAVVWPFVAELDGEVQWKQNLDFHGGPGAAGPAGLVVADIHQAWFSGDLSIRGRAGRTLATVEIDPHGRYGGRLVVRVTRSGEALTAWNRLPAENSAQAQGETTH
ncbi:MAG: hypothetical protein ABGZ35_24795 [Planctomycetaceae bacterium]